jgi:predicted nuclease of predicted toxin-antitoxin system
MAARFLLDENLSPRLVSALSEQFPGSVHVRDVQLKGQSDHQIWSFAAEMDTPSLLKTMTSAV